MNTQSAIRGSCRITGASLFVLAAAISVAQPSVAWSQRIVGDSATTTPAKAKASTYDRAMKLLSAGDQSAAEHLLGESLQSAIKARIEPDINEVFLLAVMTRSRFQIEEAAPGFSYVNEASPNSAHGRAAGYLLHLDAKEPNIEENFKALQDLASQQPADPLLVWMVGVQCRSLNRNQIGAAAYAELCKLWNPGPVLVHQTYANLLDELRRHDEALIHRQLAVQLEPARWSYDGLGNTLTSLKRWKEADDAFARATELAPRHPHSWSNWAISKSARGDIAGAAKLAAKAAELKGASGR